MGEIESFRRRTLEVRSQVARMDPGVGWGELGPADERTGERWDRGNVLGHVAEMLPFWTGALRAVLDGGADVGRDEQGVALRRQAIDAAHDVGREELLRRIDDGLAGVLALLDEMTEADLDRPLTYHSWEQGDRQMDVRLALDELLIGHTEAHLRQLQELRG